MIARNPEIELGRILVRLIISNLTSGKKRE